MLDMMKVLREAIDAEYNKLLTVSFSYLNDEGMEMKEVLRKLYYACNTPFPHHALKETVFSLDVKLEEARILVAHIKGWLMAMAHQERITRDTIDCENFAAFLKNEGHSDKYIETMMELHREHMEGRAND